jgi:hypothetical protein
MPSNTHQIYSYGAAASGDFHQFTRYRGASKVSLHPLQRTGQVSARANMFVGAQGAPVAQSLGGAEYAPASNFNMKLPPVVPISGSATQNRFTV